MPTYDFVCKTCGQQFSQRQTFQEYDAHKALQCPHCGSREVEQLANPAFVVTAKKS